MLISTKGRYAMRVLIDLAENNDGSYVPLKAIAERQELSEKYLEIIIKLLVQGKLLTGQRGKGGGYKLNHEPDEISVGSVLRLTEESLAAVACLVPGQEKCPREEGCRTLPVWKKLDDMMNGYLDSVTIADMMG